MNGKISRISHWKVFARETKAYVQIIRKEFPGWKIKHAGYIGAGNKCILLINPIWPPSIPPDLRIPGSDSDELAREKMFDYILGFEERTGQRISELLNRAIEMEKWYWQTFLGKHKVTFLVKIDANFIFGDDASIPDNPRLARLVANRWNFIPPNVEATDAVTS